MWSNSSNVCVGIATLSWCFAMLPMYRKHVIGWSNSATFWIGIAIVSLCFAIVSITRHQVVVQFEVLDRYCNCVVVPCHCIQNTSPGGQTARSFGYVLHLCRCASPLYRNHVITWSNSSKCWIGIATVSLCFIIESKACHQVVKQLNVLDRYCNCVVVPCHCIDNTSPGGHTVCIFR